MAQSAYVINWTERERGFGYRPDGHTLHISKEEAIAYIKSYWSCQPDTVPDEYSAPDEPRLVEVSDSIFQRLEKEKTFWGDPTKWYTI